MERRGELGEFLRSRRKAAVPATVPPASSRRRRVSGLRREEVAALAGVSVDYYARLEQGRQSAPSESVLAAIASALCLDEAEQLHLLNLGRAEAPRGRPEPSAQSAGLGLLHLMEALDPYPVALHGLGTDILAINEAGRAVISDFYAKPAGERNVVRWFFLDPESRRFAGWDEVAAALVGTVRIDLGRHPGNRRLLALVADMKRRSPAFHDLWEEHRVAIRPPRHKVIHHPVAGDLEFELEVVTSPNDPDQMLNVFLSAKDSPTFSAVAQLVADRRSAALS